jgi:hypothetical protein
MAAEPRFLRHSGRLRQRGRECPDWVDWRREGDSNPRYGLSPYNGLANHLFTSPVLAGSSRNLDVLRVSARAVNAQSERRDGSTGTQPGTSEEGRPQPSNVKKKRMKCQRPGAGGARAVVLVMLWDDVQCTWTACRPARQEQDVRQSVRFRRLTEKLCRCGPRPIGEALIAASQGRDLVSVLESITAIDPDLLAALGARHWPPSPMEMLR